jgi:hypothetical protein
MEFASEMVVKASLNSLKITEVPTTLKPDGRSRAPHLRTWRDGWRHLVFLLAASPRWLFLYPGIFLLGTGVLGVALTSRGPINILDLQLNLNAYLIFISLILVGAQTIIFGIFSTNFGSLPESKSVSKFAKNFSLERGIILGLLLLLFALIGVLILLSQWDGNSLNRIDKDTALRISGLIVLTSGIGIQTLFASFFASMLQTK